jgi:hypothetical protein
MERIDAELKKAEDEMLRLLQGGGSMKMIVLRV